MQAKTVSIIIVFIGIIIFMYNHKRYQYKYKGMNNVLYNITKSKLSQENMKIHYESLKEIRWNDIYQQNDFDNISKDDAINKLKEFMSNQTMNYPRLPFVIRYDNKSFISKYFNILQKWNPSYFDYGPKISRRSLGRFEIYSQSHPVFKTFHDNKPLQRFLSNNSLKFKDFNDMILVNSFKQKIFDNDDNQYRYYAEKIKYLINYFPDIDEDIFSYKQWIEQSAWKPIQELIKNNPNHKFQEKWSRDDLETLISIRFSNKNQETFMHFDAIWNYFFQIWGKKLFILSSPNNIIYKYPQIHPHSGHSQLNHVWNYTQIINNNNNGYNKYDYYPYFGMNITDNNIFDNNNNNNNKIINLFVIELNEGDILLIPPYWWHHVISLNKSISMHFWLNSHEYLIANREIYTLPLPFELEWSLSLRIYLLKAFFKLIIYYSSLNHYLLFHQLYHLRYKPLIQQNKFIKDKQIENNVKSICHKNDQFYLLRETKFNDFERMFTKLDITQKDVILIAKNLKISISDNVDNNKNDIGYRLWKKFENISIIIGDKFVLMNETTSKLLILQNYIEYVVNVVIGTHNVIPFLQFCTDTQLA